VQLAAPSTQTWPVVLGWEDEMLKLTHLLGSRDNAAKKLFDLVELPSKARVACSSDGIAKAVEQGLALSNRLNIKYLKDGAEWVMRLHPIIRRVFSHMPCASSVILLALTILNHF
jgi:hypothetical protein